MFFIIDIIPMLKYLSTYKGTCDTCQLIGEVKLIKSYQCLRLFFIPIFKWSIKYYLQPSCGVPVAVDEEVAIRLLHGDITINHLHLEHAVYNSNSCTQCGKQLEQSFEYCPYCGHRK